MKKFQANAYQLVETGKWRFGGVLTGDEHNPVLNEIDSHDVYESKEEAEKALSKYCKDNNYTLKTK